MLVRDGVGDTEVDEYGTGDNLAPHLAGNRTEGFAAVFGLTVVFQWIVGFADRNRAGYFCLPGAALVLQIALPVGPSLKESATGVMASSVNVAQPPPAIQAAAISSDFISYLRSGRYSFFCLVWT
jgi:hypothetical protein